MPTGDVQGAQSAVLNNSQLQSVGGSYVGSSTWPNYWPNNYTYFYPAVAAEEYANAVEIQVGEHDATIRFYRQRDRSKSLVHTITVPLALLDLFAPKRGKK